MKMLLLLLMLQLSYFSYAPESVGFTLRNTSLVSVRLQIPGVMNPNLVPLSNSGVGLEVGQKVFFLYRNKPYLLLEVSPKLKDQVLDVPKLIRKRKQELGL